MVFSEVARIRVEEKTDQCKYSLNRFPKGLVRTAKQGFFPQLDCGRRFDTGVSGMTVFLWMVVNVQFVVWVHL